jgi:hypothetical protein
MVHRRKMARATTNKQLIALYFQEYLEAVVAARQFQPSDLRHWEVLQSFAEFQFRLNGGSHCVLCKATVRHTIPVAAQRKYGHTDTYACLCSRCYEGERANSERMIMQIGEARVEESPRQERHELPLSGQLSGQLDGRFGLPPEARASGRSPSSRRRW